MLLIYAFVSSRQVLSDARPASGSGVVLMQSFVSSAEQWKESRCVDDMKEEKHVHSKEDGEVISGGPRVRTIMRIFNLDAD